MHPKWHIVSIFLLIEIFTQISVFRLVFFRCHSVSPKWGFHKRFRCPIALPDRLAQLNVLLLCNHIVHYIRLSFLFQSSLPQGERRSKVDQFLDLVKISVHAPTRGATRKAEYPDADTAISIHAPTRGATFSLSSSNDLSNISIHAPTRGATAYILLNKDSIEFQSTLPRGERLTSLIVARLPSRFQSTLPRGERQFIKAHPSTAIYISIHAPTRGATPHFTRSLAAAIDFNPRSHEGSDALYAASVSPSLYFNPRSHEGSDRSIPRRFCNFSISIHAPTRGATLRDLRIKCNGMISIHAPTRGATGKHTPDLLSLLFQSTLPRGERHNILLPSEFIFVISIHAPTRGATMDWMSIVV